MRPCLIFLALFSSVSTLAAEDWPVWRGASGNHRASPGQNLPERFGPEEHLIWRTLLPGRGHSSPIVIGNHLYLTTAEPQQETQSVLGFDCATGRQLWKTEVNRGGLPKIHKTNTHASPSLACNGETLFALFQNHDRLQLVWLSLTGDILREVSIEPFTPKAYEFGCGLSPLLFGSLVIVAYEFEEGGMAAYDQRTGQRVWQTSRPNVSYSSPIVAHIGGIDQLLLTGNEKVTSFDPLTGKERWSLPGATQATCGTVAWEGDMIFASGGFPDADTVGIRYSETPEVVWHAKERCYEQSLLVNNGYVYGVNDTGIAFCLRGSDGHEMWKSRLCSQTSASPVLADGIIYQGDERGKLVAFRESPEKLQKVFEIQLGDEIYATPTICGGRFYCRVAAGENKDEERQETLYCFGQ